MMFRTPFFLPLLYPGLVWSIPTEEKSIYLTFDDGPMPGPTEFVLDQLAKYEAKGTFFCIGDNVKKHRETFRKIVDGGHGIGNHTFNHWSGWKHKKNDYVNNVDLCEQELKHSGFPPNGVPIFRPPYGRIKRSQIAALNNHKIIMWGVLTQDYSKHMTPERCFTGSLKACYPGAIVVFHDSIKAQKNLEYALPRLLENLKGQGYLFKAIPH